jgi:hypothetical protein
VARRVDQVQDVVVPIQRAVVHPRCLGLDRDAALALELHLIEELIDPVPRLERTGPLEQSIRERRLAVVDVCHDCEVADPLDRRSFHPRSFSSSDAK